jgi:oxygen-independent coproporphyrinogen-3 oxidase
VGISLPLYIHIPFCSSLCDYCDFFSVKKENVDPHCVDSFLEAVIKDINYQIKYFDVSNITTAYIGGGTPSILGRDIGVLLDSLKKNPGFNPVEFTIEANPESVTEEFLSVCRDGGVNRLSLGIQTFHQESRSAIGRGGKASELKEKLSLASLFFPGMLSVDLITGLPYQNRQIVLEDISQILDFEPSHVSLYSLTVENNTPLENKIKTKQVKMPDSEECDLIWLAARNALENCGLRHYEVSNFARTGKECLHNIRYWRMKGWIGAGPSASGTLIDEENGTAKRFTYTQDIDEYIKRPVIHNAVCEEIDTISLIRESLLMGFRYIEGPDSEVFCRRFGMKIEDCIPKTMSRGRERGFFEGTNVRKELMLFLNSFLSDAFLELVKSTTPP